MTTAYLSAFSGSNLAASSTISNAGTSTPTLNVTPFNPDPLETIWQQYLLGVSDVAGKTLSVIVTTTNKETDTLYAGTYDGPWWSPDPNALVWNKVSSFVSSGSTMTYSITPGANSTIYIASLPPQTLARTLAWINDLAATYPTLIHDDLKPRVRKGIGPYVCGVSGTHKDESGRTLSGLHMYGFRISNDSAGPSFPNAKRELILMAGVHSHEWNGFLELQGFIDELLTNASLSVLLDEFNIFVYPAHSVGGIELGFRRSEAINSTTQSYDSNRYWGDGTGTVPTVVLWQDIFDEQHGVFLHNVVGQIDFHDATKNNTTDGNAYYNYVSGMTNFATIESIMTGQSAELSGVPLGVSVTTNEYFHDKGINFAITVEARDERNSVVQTKEYGRATARAVKGIYEADLLDLFDGIRLDSPQIESFESGLGSWTVNTGSVALTRSNTASSTANTGADTAFDGSWRIYTEAGTSGAPVAEGSTFIAERTGIDFTLFAEMRFRWMRYGCQSSTLSVQVNNGSGYSTAWSSSINQATQVWKQEGVNLSDLTSTDGAIRFLVTVSGANRHMNDQDIDYIEFVPYSEGFAGLTADLTKTLANATVSSDVSHPVTANFSTMLTSALVSSTGASGAVLFDALLDSVSVSSSVLVPLVAACDQTLSNVSVVSDSLTLNNLNASLNVSSVVLSSTVTGDTGESLIDLNKTLDNCSLSSVVVLVVQGDLSKTLNDATVVSHINRDLGEVPLDRLIKTRVSSRILQSL